MQLVPLKSVFKAVYGMPIASYMKEYRMKLASNMLLQEDKSISELAAAVDIPGKEDSFLDMPFALKSFLLLVIWDKAAF